jgi:small subunit ribosomal protein S4
MARYTGPRARICRRLEYPVFESSKFASLRKSYPPGQHGQARRRKLSNYGIQLREKQRIKYLYGVLEKQFRNYFKKASIKVGATGDNLLVSLESRLDNTVYRLGLAQTRSAARQFVTHKHFLVNNKVVNIPSYCLSEGDTVQVRDKSKKNNIFLDSMRRIKSDNPMPWLTLDKSKLTGVFNKVPVREEIIEPLNEQLVVELYSK